MDSSIISSSASLLDLLKSLTGVLASLLAIVGALASTRSAQVLKDRINDNAGIKRRFNDEKLQKQADLEDDGNRPGKSSSVAGSIVLRDCATMKLSPQCRSGTAGHHHPSHTRSKHFLVLSTIETLEIPFKRCWIT